MSENKTNTNETEKNVVENTTAETQNQNIEVEDNGVGLKNGLKPSEGIGLSNTRARLQQLYGSGQRLDFVSSPNGGLVVRIEIPFRSTVGG